MSRTQVVSKLTQALPVLMGEFVVSTPAKVSLLSLSCCEATRLASDALDRELTRRERWALRVHTFLCTNCRRFAAQIGTIHHAVARVTEDLRKQWSAGLVTLSAERRAQIKRMLAEAAQADSRS